MIQDFWKIRKMEFKPLQIKLLSQKCKPLKDTDRDTVPDVFDCAPRNPNKQGIGHVIKGTIQKRKSPKLMAKAQDIMSTAQYYIDEGNIIIQKGEETMDDAMVEYGNQVKSEGETLMQQALKMEEQAQLGYSSGEQLQQREKEVIKRNIREGLKLKKRKSSKKTSTKGSDIPPHIGFPGSRKKTVHQSTRAKKDIKYVPRDICEKALQGSYTQDELMKVGFYPSQEKNYGYNSNRSSQYQEISRYGKSVCPYRPISREQVSLSYNDIMPRYMPLRIPMVFPRIRPYNPVVPPFLKKKRIMSYYEEK